MKRICAALPAMIFTSWLACESAGPMAGGSTSTSSGDAPSDGRCRREGEACSTRDDCCPFYGSPLCGRRACVEGTCRFARVDVPKSQKRGDCIVWHCREDGNEKIVGDPTDLPDDGNPCTIGECNERIPANSAIPPGPAPDGSGFCDERGRRVDCNEAADCNDPLLSCSELGKCVPLWCVNGIHDADRGETATDCGGPCDLCRSGRRCATGADCLHGVCGPDKLCATPTCNDGVRNDREADVDCGDIICGVRCDDGAHCYTDTDCKSAVCFGGTCQPPTCEDHIQNGREEDRDCGGPDCPSCY